MGYLPSRDKEASQRKICVERGEGRGEGKINTKKKYKQNKIKVILEERKGVKCNNLYSWIK